MSADTVDSSVRELLGTALGTQVGPDDPFERPDHDEWTSLMHIELVFMLEERFDVRLSDEDIVAMTSPATIVAVLASKHVV
jgi:acyl carrier protein